MRGGDPLAKTEFASQRIQVRPGDKWSFDSQLIPRETPLGVVGTRPVIEIVHQGRTYHQHFVCGDLHLVMDMETGDFVTLDFSDVD